jgi:hypothetical protein
MIKTAHENGHFYSPIVDPTQIRPEVIWPANPAILGIDFDDPGQERILRDVLPRHLKYYDYPDELQEVPDLQSFYTRNSQFSWLDPRALFSFLREWCPQKVIEVGSGFSTLLFADVNRRFFGGSIDIKCVEPYPREFLTKGIEGINGLIQKKVQDVPFSVFEGLQAGDILFIDSSHVAKTGSDVLHLFFEILPRLAKGVIIHVHDIFFPNDYPREWVIDENRSWNEQYLLRALLTHSCAYRVLFGCSYAYFRFPELVEAALAHPSGRAFGGGSFWMEKICPPD